MTTMATLSDAHPELPAGRTPAAMALDLARLYAREVSGANYDVRGGSRYLDGIRDAFIAITGLPEDFHEQAEMILDDLAMYVADLDGD